MIYVVAGVILGLLVGLNFNIVYSPEYAVYISLAVLAILNSIFEMLIESTNGELTITKALVGLAGDLVFGLLLGFVGEQLGLPIYLAAVFAFGNNIYKNFKIYVNFMLEKYKKTN